MSYVREPHDHVYKRQEIEGSKAYWGTRCPYGVSLLGPRSAWLAGHYDAHGKDAWLVARGSNEKQ